MAKPELDKEIEKRKLVIYRAERTVRETVKAFYRSEYTALALDNLQRTLITEKAVLAELEKLQEKKGWVMV
jgi:cytochrome c-type biogenesis protein CcmH/NrfG